MGPLACLLSAVAFGVMAVFAKLAYDEGVSLQALLLVRFGAADGEPSSEELCHGAGTLAREYDR